MFISNPTEMTLLKDSAFINRVAKCTSEGIAKAMDLSKKQTDGHWAKKAHDELLNSGVINTDHSHELDEPISRAEVISIANRIRKGEK